MQKIITHPQFGTITIRKKAGAVSIRLSVHPLRGINISIPYFTSFSVAERFIDEKSDWIRRTLEKQSQKVESRKIIYREGLEIKTLQRIIRFKADDSPFIAIPAPPTAKSDANSSQNRTESSLQNHESHSSQNRAGVQKNFKLKVRVSDTNATVIYPASADPLKFQAQLKEAVVKYLRYEAKEELPQRAAQLAAIHGFKYNKIFLKNNTSNWGSCSKLNNINLNIHLVRLTPELCDYIILHELCHLRHRNHGPAFHSLLNTLCLNHCNKEEKQLTKELRKYTTRL